MTTLQELVGEWLNDGRSEDQKPVDPVAWIRARRDAGRSWDLTAVDLYDATGRRRWIPPETLRIWVRAADG